MKERFLPRKKNYSILSVKKNILFLNRQKCEYFLVCSDPKLIAFLRRRNQQQGAEEFIRSNEKLPEQNMEVDPPSNLPIEVNSRWIHMDKIEQEKLEWMKDLPKPPTINHSVSNNS